MSIEIRVLKNPRYGPMDISGELGRVTVSVDDGETVSGFFVNSPQIELRFADHSISFQVNNANNTVQNLCFLTGKTVEYERIEKLSDILDSLERLHLPSYWKKEELKFFLFVYIRLALSVLSSDSVDSFLQDKEADDLARLLSKQKRITEVLLFLFEAFHIQHSGYVDNNRARSLLSLGLDPKLQYEWDEIRSTGKRILKDTHPDTLLGDELVFKKINAAISYLK